MLLELLVFVLVISNGNGELDTVAYPKVTINRLGSTTAVIGTRNASWNGLEYYAFQGMPYAKPPLLDMRFKDPQAWEEWPAVLDARREGHDCPQPLARSPSEDCLNLNVYSRTLNANASLPVLVLIHPGGFYLGSGLAYAAGPDYLMAKDIVLVTFNYRLGTLGFLNLGTEDIPGNAGLKDQVLAMRWVRKYIRNFGGNPEDVTLLGYSAGGFSVSAHLVSPMSKGLFHKAVAMSGVVPPQLIIPEGDYISLASRQAQILNCSKAVLREDILKCLNQRTGMEIAGTLRQMFDFGHDNPVYLWLPVIERDYGQERFLTEDVFTSLKEGRFHKVPLLTGFVTGEFCWSAKSIAQSAQLEQEFYEKWQELWPIAFMYKGRRNEREVNKALKDHYLQGNGPNHTNTERLCDLFSDSLIRFGTMRLAEFISQHGSDVYAYLYAHKSARVEHMDDFKNLFRVADGSVLPQDGGARAVQLYTDFVYGFMLRGKLFDDREGTSAKYPQGYALISDSVEFKEGLSFPEVEFWNNLFPLNASD